jgi:hypothetical protein
MASVFVLFRGRGDEFVEVDQEFTREASGQNQPPVDVNSLQPKL